MQNPILINETDNMPRKDYPRPSWRRDKWMNLNGEWEFAFDFGKSGIERGMVKNGVFPLTINVPFCPESALSGIAHTDFIPAVWYRKRINLDSLSEGKRVILHFGAVDYDSKIWVNGILCAHHIGGYTSFEVDITHSVKEGENVIVVYAEDDLRSGKQPIGKQCKKYKSSECSYTRTTGIWQTVWMEFVSDKYLKRPMVIPRALDGELDVTLWGAGNYTGCKAVLTAFYKGKEVGKTTCSFSGESASARIAVKEVHLWNPGKPEIYDLEVCLYDESGEKLYDRVESYFALRDVALSENSLTINGKNVFMRLILDQGFNPEGIYTAPSDEFLKRDIELSMSLGFNGARLHQRVFEERTLYWADMLGYILWGEYATNMYLGNAEVIENFLPQWIDMIKRDFNHPSIIGWCFFNETYHDNELDENAVRLIYKVTKSIDPYRPVIDASGGVHYETDMFDVHDYEQNAERLSKTLAPMIDNEKYYHSTLDRYRGGEAPHRDENFVGQPYWISEYGGTYWNPDSSKEGWGYGDNPKTEEEFAKRYEDLTHVLISHPRVCGFCYTQLTDIEQEQNGLYSYNRAYKFSQEVYDRIKKANSEIASVEK